MKTTVKSLLTLLAASLMLMSCGNDDTADIIIYDNSTTNNGGGSNPPSNDVINISGTYTQDLTLNSNNSYLVNGPLVMAEGTTLTIPAGMTIEALSSGSDVYVAISQGAKIMAEGTAQEPIVFTSNSNNPAAGDWGGLILLGKAPINSVTGGTETATSEIGSLPYGGNVADDDSGILRYVRVEYSGGKADGQSENNGFSFYGVGNSTTVEYVQMYEGLDDGFEFFGGSVNVSYLSVVDAQDDSIDWTEGYSGTINHAYVMHGADHDKGIEADGYNTDIGNNSNPVFWSTPTVNNLAIYGLGSGTGNEAIRLRAGTRVIMNNVWIEGFNEGIDMDDMETGVGVTSDITSITDITFTDVNLKLKNDTGETFTDTDVISGDGNGTATDYATWGAGWTVE
ncbi:hypothetical protein KH5_10540 [Urechidicola sp. KH5]